MWKGQLNIRNLLDSRTLLSQRANIGAGFVSVYAVPEPRSFILLEPRPIHRNLSQPQQRPRDIFLRRELFQRPPPAIRLSHA